MFVFRRKRLSESSYPHLLLSRLMKLPYWVVLSYDEPTARGANARLWINLSLDLRRKNAFIKHYMTIPGKNLKEEWK